MTTASEPPLKLTTRARKALLDCFDPDDLRILVADSFEWKLEWVTANRKFETVVFELIEAVVKEGTLAVLLRAAAEKIPGKPVLARLCDEAARGGSAGPGAPPPGDVIAQFAAEFRDCGDVFDHLHAYKNLHDTLHKLDGDLPVLEPEAEAWWTAGTPVSAETTRKLEKYAAGAAKWAKKTDSPNELGELMDELNTTVATFLKSANPKERRAAFRELENVPAQKLGELNSGLVRCAESLDLVGLVVLAGRAAAACPGPGAAADLRNDLADFLTPAAQLDGLIRDHNLSQRIDSQLRNADAAKTADDVPSWFKLQARLAEIAENRPGDPPFLDVRKAADAFEAGMAGIEPLLANFAHFFLALDATLREVANDILLAAKTLQARPEIQR